MLVPSPAAIGAFFFPFEFAGGFGGATLAATVVACLGFPCNSAASVFFEEVLAPVKRGEEVSDRGIDGADGSLPPFRPMDL